MLEEKVTYINKLIRENSEVFHSGKTPNLTELEEQVLEFTNFIKTLPANSAKSYLDIVKIWIEQIKVFQDKILDNKQKIQEEIGQLQTQSKAHTAYLKNNF